MVYFDTMFILIEILIIGFIQPLLAAFQESDGLGFSNSIILSACKQLVS